MQSTNKVVSDKQLADLMKREVERFKIHTPESAKVFRQARDVLLNGVPMPWMSDWGSTHPNLVKIGSVDEWERLPAAIKISKITLSWLEATPTGPEDAAVLISDNQCPK
jgi:hypothetical protein